MKKKEAKPVVRKWKEDGHEWAELIKRESHTYIVFHDTLCK
jgi:hypothetical protein